MNRVVQSLPNALRAAHYREQADYREQVDKLRDMAAAQAPGSLRDRLLALAIRYDE